MPTDATPPTSEPSFDTLFTLLANQQRRSILSHLTTMQGMTISHQALVDVLTHSLAVSRERLRLNLHHRHLPKLADCNLVEYDSEEETIRYQSSDRLEDLLEIGQHSALE
ncbi:DUF7344 domain-containing protein [Haladaptatus caseinilyticus]|uniref:DUF7344 domain-containing protein n=1 Tax=Haladaptatus caseinilyticus TaxID=2993314 RepID=UPI00224AC318|nr:hypothetical protein [Haladaptatus caseinilyticus]